MVAKDARGEPEDDALDVIDLITDEPVPIGRRIEPPPDEERTPAAEEAPVDPDRGSRRQS